MTKIKGAINAGARFLINVIGAVIHLLAVSLLPGLRWRLIHLRKLSVAVIRSVAVMANLVAHLAGLPLCHVGCILLLLHRVHEVVLSQRVCA